MLHQWKTIASFLTPEDAEVARLALADNGISTSFENATIVGMVWYYGNATGGVKLLVPAADELRAREVLNQKASLSGDNAQIVVCQECGAHVPAHFDVCWSCGEPIRSDDGSIAPVSIDGASDIAEDDAEEASPGDKMAWRALKAAVLGLFILPPLLAFYSWWLILRLIFSDKPLSKKGTRYCWFATIVNLATCLMVGFFLRCI